MSIAIELVNEEIKDQERWVDTHRDNTEWMKGEFHILAVKAYEKAQVVLGTLQYIGKRLKEAEA